MTTCGMGQRTLVGVLLAVFLLAGCGGSDGDGSGDGSAATIAAPTASASTQNSIVLGAVSANTLLTLRDVSGDVVLSFLSRGSSSAGALDVAGTVAQNAVHARARHARSPRFVDL